MSYNKFLREGFYMNTQVFVEIIKKRMEMNAYLYKEAQLEIQRCVRTLDTYKYDKYRCDPLTLFP